MKAFFIKGGGYSHRAFYYQNIFLVIVFSPF